MRLEDSGSDCIILGIDMRIKSLSIQNYKSFLDEQVVHFEPGFNVLVGSNNSGKTNVLSLLEMPIGIEDRHRSTWTIPEFGGANSNPSKVLATVVTTMSELQRLTGGGALQFPVSGAGPDIQKILFDAYINETEVQATFHLISQDCITIKTPELLDIHSNKSSLAAIITGKDAEEFQIVNPGNTFAITWSWLSILRKMVYRFGAGRRPSARTTDNSNTDLKSDGSNLAFCINHLQTSDAHGHQQLCELVNRVFPEVPWVQSIPAGGEFVLQCLPEPPVRRRHDLARPLDAMGTGLGNIISMLYVLLTSRYPQVIAIDEPNAFLHPRALRELFSILDEFGVGHQFVISAHSADVLTSVRPATITMLSLKDGSTQIQQAGANEIRTLREGLAELGIRMTDLHSRDRVLWVEGQTEEIVIPMLLKLALPGLSSSTAVLRVEHTGAFDKRGRDAIEVCKIYERLSESSSLVPPSVGMLLDSESRPDTLKTDIESRSGGKIRFLKKQMLESYVTQVKPIHGVLNTLEENISLDQVSEALEEALTYKSNASQILADIFEKLTNSRHTFRKTIHTPLLFQWMVDNDRTALEELLSELRMVFSEPSK